MTFPSGPRLVAATLALIPFATLGLGRFAYGLILPGMTQELDWSYFDAGIVTTANAAGYLLGAATGAIMSRRFGEWNMIVVGVALTGLSLAATALTGLLPVILMFRFGAGLFGGWAYISGGVRATALSKQDVPPALIWFTAGAGTAIVISAVGHQTIDESFGGWKGSWVALGILSTVCTVVLGVIVPRDDTTQARSDAQSLAPGAAPDAVITRAKGLEASYALFGLGYISYVTFIGAYVKSTNETISASQFWAVLGLAGLAASFVWPVIFARYGTGATYPIALAICAAGVAEVLLFDSLAGVLVSAALFGGSFLAVVSGVTAAARDRIEPTGWASSIVWLTVAFGAGQVLGPMLGGALGDTTAGLRLGLGASAIILLVGSAVAVADHLHQRTLITAHQGETP